MESAKALSAIIVSWIDLCARQQNADPLPVRLSASMRMRSSKSPKIAPVISGSIR